MIYNIYIWTKKGKCIYYQAWHRQTSPKDSIEQEQSLMYGFLLAIKSFVDKTSPSTYVSSQISYLNDEQFQTHFCTLYRRIS
jgi:hypothetical protein